jgi:hypothetical protein
MVMRGIWPSSGRPGGGLSLFPAMLRDHVNQRVLCTTGHCGHVFALCLALCLAGHKCARSGPFSPNKRRFRASCPKFAVLLIVG